MNKKRMKSMRRKCSNVFSANFLRDYLKNNYGEAPDVRQHYICI